MGSRVGCLLKGLRAGESRPLEVVHDARQQPSSTTIISHRERFDFTTKVLAPDIRYVHNRYMDNSNSHNRQVATFVNAHTQSEVSVCEKHEQDLHSSDLLSRGAHYGRCDVCTPISDYHSQDEQPASAIPVHSTSQPVEYWKHHIGTLQAVVVHPGYEDGSDGFFIAHWNGEVSHPAGEDFFLDESEALAAAREMAKQ